ncbi:pyridoxal-phosphate dependent enzyme [Candidatus Acetothermia bacterium]|jgi:cystathionine beta-synthase|nr:pyridoxal-phosphate dependent enzyme [Candidatus Acetothermia bacterium]MCI2431497.1 pyridoxal-phosphate dependent enzyme [Candidatus Acetothermia bacterium]MCI2436460.1 pyridoxal-phosphate dependent enzyme [Candidatus Acetothermia bacterium]
MRVAENLLGLIGRTPMVTLNRINPVKGVRLLAKLEYFNPGGSVKDRIGIAMVEAAERAGKLKPGDWIVEPTSGNTGVGLCIAAILKGYRVVFTMPDKVSPEKIDLLKAYGAEVVVCPTAVAPEDPESYYSVAKKIAQERPAFLPNQYENSANTEAHYRATGPEIWEQTDGKLEAFIAGVGTGGTISGIGRFLKEKNAQIKIIGADPEGSMIYTEFYKLPRNVHTYLIEGIGEDIIPGTLDFKVIDEIVRVYDKESYAMARELAQKEAILTGSSGGAALVAALRCAEKIRRGTLVVLIPDTGRQYLSKVYSERWLRENGLV